MAKIIDLHIHTNLSDGSLSPKEIIDRAYRNKVDFIAIADHDTVEAYNDELYNYAKNKNIKIINAVEVSTKLNNVGIHVLGYNIDVTNEELRKNLDLLKNSRHEYLKNVAKKLQNLGYEINIKELDEIEIVTKAHIANNIIENDKNKRILLNVFSHIPSKGEFIETIMNEGCPAYTPKYTITPTEAAKLIRNAGGKVILAHPVAYKYEDNLNMDDILEIVKETKADGIEANYIYIDRNNKKINEINKWNNFAKENNLIVTIGSDFHSNDSIHPDIGLINEGLNLTEDIVNNIIENIESNNKK